MPVRPISHRHFRAAMEYWISLRRFVFTGIVNRSRDTRILLWGALLIAVLAAGELAGRALGLHIPMLYQVTSYGYRVAPDQDIRRFGHRVFINHQGLRNEPITPLPTAGTLRILCLGDSITNGGAMTDQNDTYPYQLQRLLGSGGRRMEVLNASAPGWAIANEAGWLRESGTFGSHTVVLTIGTLDLFQELAGPETVDGHPSFPSRAPALALENLVIHYVMPRFLRGSVADPGAQHSAQSIEGAKRNIAQLLDMADLASRSGATPAVLFIEQPGHFEMSDIYTASAKALLFEALKRRGVRYEDTRERVERAGGVSLFRDGLHPNTEGNRVLAQAAAKLLAPAIGGISSTGK
jgi:lysophospholipase L1-like esterase